MTRLCHQCFLPAEISGTEDGDKAFGTVRSHDQTMDRTRDDIEDCIGDIALGEQGVFWQQRYNWVLDAERREQVSGGSLDIDPWIG